ncbi:MAG: hypothetical protein EA417_10415 [Gammaproteobacteria bacterium]|nr:MAG: hypothetical protein EA417_10415 [Gammaproteobacteria bacterium]
MQRNPADPTSPQDALERFPVIGGWLADSFDAWVGIADALNLGGLRTVLLADPDEASPDRITRADPTSPPSTSGQWIDDQQAPDSPSLSSRAA